MRNKVFLLVFILLISFGCKKVESEEEVKIESKQINNTIDNENSKIYNLIGALSGKVPRGQLKMFDASIMDLKGKVTNLTDYKDKVIFLNLWATWCPPCREEMPSMEKLYKDLKNENFEIIAVSQGEDKATVEKFLKRYNYSFPIFIDHKNEIGKSYSTGSIPTSYLIDKNGFIIAQFVGGRDWSSQIVKDLINELLK